MVLSAVKQIVIRSGSLAVLGSAENMTSLAHTVLRGKALESIVSLQI